MGMNPGIKQSDRLLSITTLSFDISVLEIFLPLSAGASVVIADQDSIKDGHRLAEVIENYDISVMQATPATWFLLIETGWQGNKNLKALCGGEAVSRELVNSLVSLCDSVWNMYGPTETTVWSALAELSYGEGAVVPIGKPIDNTQIYILDEDLQPVVPGEAGEIHIGGAGVARGYLGRPELTHDRFIDYYDPTSGYSRIYKTGDLGRILPDGSIECIGRSDSQIKLRGYRIELGEIEAAIEALPLVRQAIVVLQEISQTDKKLVAFYRTEGAPESANELRNSLKKVLPDYMIPSYFEPVDVFPLTPNGKVDRKTLTGMQLTSGFGKRVITPPSTPVEIEVSKIWEDLLKVKDISIHDSFLELGGHSLLASIMIQRLNQTFNIHISLMDVLTNGLTIVELVSLIEERVVEEASEEDIESVLGMLEGLSDDEIKELLKKAGL
ncbi:Dimodular nonribosomal peptide synthase [compost metagenome]